MLRSLCILCWAVAASGYTLTSVTPRAAAALSPLSPPARSAVARMGLIDWLGNLIYERDIIEASRKPRGRSAAGSAAMSRLKVVLAHDRTGLDELTLAKIRLEIQQVVAKYVKIDADSVQFDMQYDDEITLATATFPLAGPRAGGVAI